MLPSILGLYHVFFSSPEVESCSISNCSRPICLCIKLEKLLTYISEKTENISICLMDIQALYSSISIHWMIPCIYTHGRISHLVSSLFSPSLLLSFLGQDSDPIKPHSRERERSFIMTITFLYILHTHKIRIPPPPFLPFFPIYIYTMQYDFHSVRQKLLILCLQVRGVLSKSC